MIEDEDEEEDEDETAASPRRALSIGNWKLELGND
jgi:hypothetical protein